MCNNSYLTVLHVKTVFLPKYSAQVFFLADSAAAQAIPAKSPPSPNWLADSETLYPRTASMSLRIICGPPEWRPSWWNVSETSVRKPARRAVSIEIE